MNNIYCGLQRGNLDSGIRREKHYYSLDNENRYRGRCNVFYTSAFAERIFSTAFNLCDGLKYSWEDPSPDLAREPCQKPLTKGCARPYPAHPALSGLIRRYPVISHPEGAQLVPRP